MEPEDEEMIGVDPNDDSDPNTDSDVDNPRFDEDEEDE
jgi:hypothetical protein